MKLLPVSDLSGRAHFLHNSHAFVATGKSERSRRLSEYQLLNPKTFFMTIYTPIRFHYCKISQK